MKKIILTESEKKQIICEREQAIINSFKENLDRMDKIDEGRFGNMARGLAAGAMMGLAGQQAQAQEPVKPPTEKQSMYGTPEQRAAKKAQREANRKKIENDYIKGAVNANLYEPIDDAEFQQGMSQVNDIDFFDRKVTYAEMNDGTKIKVFLKKYSKFLDNNKNKPDADRTFGAGFCNTGKNGERISEPGDTETNRKHCTGSAEGNRQKQAVQSGQNKT